MKFKIAIKSLKKEDLSKMGFLGEGGSDCSSGAILTCHWKLPKDWKCDRWKVFAQEMLKLHKCSKIWQLT